MRVTIGEVQMDLTDEQVADLRRQLAVVPPADEWITAAQVAERLGVSRDYVYAHSGELGAKPLGTGPKAHLRFNAAKVEGSTIEPRPEPKPKARKRQKRKGAGVPLLEVRGTTATTKERP